MAPLEALKIKIGPFIFRRLKQDVAKELPKKTEQILYCSLDAEQKKLYQETLQNHYIDLKEKIRGDGFNKSR